MSVNYQFQLKEFEKQIFGLEEKREGLKGKKYQKQRTQLQLDVEKIRQSPHYKLCLKKVEDHQTTKRQEAEKKQQQIIEEEKEKLELWEKKKSNLFAAFRGKTFTPCIVSLQRLGYTSHTMEEDFSPPRGFVYLRTRTLPPVPRRFA